VNTDNGKASGNIDIGTYIPASAAISGDLAFFGNYDGVFYCMDLKQKKVKWKTEGGGPFLASPAILGNRVITGSQNKTVYCYDTRNGKLIWKFKALNKVDASPVITGNLVIIAYCD